MKGTHMKSEKRLSDYSCEYLFLDATTMKDKLREDTDYQNNLYKKNDAIRDCIQWLIFMIPLALTSLSDGKLLPLSIVDIVNLAFWAIAFIVFILKIKSFYDASKAIKTYTTQSNSYAKNSFARVQPMPSVNITEAR